jgi:hypothetical protein
MRFESPKHLHPLNAFIDAKSPRPQEGTDGIGIIQPGANTFKEEVIHYALKGYRPGWSKAGIVASNSNQAGADGPASFDPDDRP